MNRFLNPFVYPFSKIMVTVDGGIPSVEGEASEDGLLMIVPIKPEGKASLCMVTLSELLLLNNKYQREKKNGQLNASHIVADPTARVIVPPR